VTWGAGPRAGQNLILAAKARALLHGRTYVAVEDVKAVALPVLRHRVITNYAAKADNVTPDELIRKLLALVPREG
jgi:MoxR-like ATPase